MASKTIEHGDLEGSAASAKVKEIGKVVAIATAEELLVLRSWLGRIEEQRACDMVKRTWADSIRAYADFSNEMDALRYGGKPLKAVPVQVFDLIARIYKEGYPEDVECLRRGVVREADAPPPPPKPDKDAVRWAASQAVLSEALAEDEAYAIVQCNILVMGGISKTALREAKVGGWEPAKVFDYPSLSRCYFFAIDREEYLDRGTRVLRRLQNATGDTVMCGVLARITKEDQGFARFFGNKPMEIAGSFQQVGGAYYAPLMPAGFAQRGGWLYWSFITAPGGAGPVTLDDEEE